MLFIPHVLVLNVVKPAYVRHRAGYLWRRSLSVSPCGTLAVPHHVLLIPSLITVSSVADKSLLPVAPAL